MFTYPEKQRDITKFVVGASCPHTGCLPCMFVCCV